MASRDAAVAQAASTGGARLDLAVRRLEQAVGRLQQRLALRLAEANADVGGLFDRDRANLAAELDAAKARNRELEEAATQARAAVEEAMAAMRSDPSPE